MVNVNVLPKGALRSKTALRPGGKCAGAGRAMLQAIVINFVGFEPVHQQLDRRTGRQQCERSSVGVLPGRSADLEESLRRRLGEQAGGHRAVGYPAQDNGQRSIISQRGGKHELSPTTATTTAARASGPRFGRRRRGRVGGRRTPRPWSTRRPSRPGTRGGRCRFPAADRTG